MRVRIKQQGILPSIRNINPKNLQKMLKKYGNNLIILEERLFNNYKDQTFLKDFIRGATCGGPSNVK